VGIIAQIAAIIIAIASLVVTYVWNRRLARQAERSADAAEKMVAIAADKNSREIAPQLDFGTFERSKLHVTNRSGHDIHLASFSYALGEDEKEKRELNIVLKNDQYYDFELNASVLRESREREINVTGCIELDDLQDHKWIQEWGFGHDGRDAWGAKIKEIPS